MGQTIVVQRHGALGDVVMTTPIVRRLRRENPEAHISVVTAFPDVFRYNPHISAGVAPSDWPVRVIDLDLAYEKRPHLHIVRAYMQEAFGDLGEESYLQQELHTGSSAAPATLKSYRPRIAVHAAVSGWRNRTLPRSTWQYVLLHLIKSGFWPILVGTERDAVPGIQATLFLNADIAAQAKMISRCSMFIGSDSGLLHVAGATDVPIVGVFTSVAAETRLPWRHGALGWRCETVTPALDCIGCHQRVPPPMTTESCELPDIICTTSVDPTAILDAVFRLREKLVDD